MSHNSRIPHNATEKIILKTVNMWVTLNFVNDILIKNWHYNIWIAIKVLSLQCTYFVVDFTFLGLARWFGFKT
jgi:hypothetical protein